MTDLNFLTSECGVPCTSDREAMCSGAVKQDPTTGRYFITMGHAAFNDRANNGVGYSTPDKARVAIARRLGHYTMVRAFVTPKQARDLGLASMSGVARVSLAQVRRHGLTEVK
jgi:hypothetical protein